MVFLTIFMAKNKVFLIFWIMVAAIESKSFFKSLNIGQWIVLDMGIVKELDVCLFPSKLWFNNDFNLVKIGAVKNFTHSLLP